MDNVSNETVLLLDFTDPNTVRVDKASGLFGDLSRLKGTCMLGHAPCMSVMFQHAVITWSNHPVQYRGSHNNKLCPWILI